MKHSSNAYPPDGMISERDREGLYKTLFNRRDVRSQFKPDAIPHEVLSRILQAAHHAPSVGFMQPWNFILVESAQVKRKIHSAFQEANNEAAEMFEGARKDQYRSMKLEGILDAPLNICITCDRDKAGPVVLGRTHNPVTDLYSTVCAVQNLWLAARAENVGVGWVSILKTEALHQVLGIPDKIIPVAYLCIGYVDHFKSRPELASAGWRQRLPLEELIYFDRWEQGQSEREDSLIDQLKLDASISDRFK